MARQNKTLRNLAIILGAVNVIGRTITAGALLRSLRKTPSNIITQRQKTAQTTLKRQPPTNQPYAEFQKEQRATEQEQAKARSDNTSGLSSWVQSVRWEPVSKYGGNIWFTPKGGKSYVVPNQPYADYLTLIDPANHPYDGTGTDLWQLGFLKGRGYRTGAPSQRASISTNFKQWQKEQRKNRK